MEGLLRTKYRIYSYGSSGQNHIACEEYSVPQNLSQQIDLIMPTVHIDTKIMTDPANRKIKRADTKGKNLHPGSPNDPFVPKKGPIIKGPGAQPDAQQPQTASLSNCNSQITPDCLRALYNFPNGTLQKSSFGIVEYTPQAYLQSDLNMFYENLARQIPNKTAPIFNSIDGGVDQTTDQGFNYNGESDLDLEYAIALGMSSFPHKKLEQKNKKKRRGHVDNAPKCCILLTEESKSVYPQKVDLYQVGDLVEGASFNNFLDALDSSYCQSNGGDNPNL